MTTITIYVLYDDREPGKWRYVGQAGNAVRRLRDHRRQMTAGIPPANMQMATLAVVDAADANSVERSFIVQFVKDGHELANIKDNPNPIENQYKYPIGPNLPRSDKHEGGPGIGARIVMNKDGTSTVHEEFFEDADGNRTVISHDEAKELFWQGLKASGRLGAVVEILLELGRKRIDRLAKEAEEKDSQSD